MGSWKLNDPPLTKGSKADDPPTLYSQIVTDDLRRVLVTSKCYLWVYEVWVSHFLNLKKTWRLERDSNPWPLRYRAVLYHLSYQANWELVTLWVRIIPVVGEDTSEYKIIYLNCGERYEDMIDWSVMSSYLSPQSKYMIFHILTCRGSIVM